MNHFKGKQFQKDMIIVAVGYYLRYNLSGSVAKFRNFRPHQKLVFSYFISFDLI